MRKLNEKLKKNIHNILSLLVAGFILTIFIRIQMLTSVMTTRVEGAVSVSM